MPKSVVDLPNRLVVSTNSREDSLHNPYAAPASDLRKLSQTSPEFRRVTGPSPPWSEFTKLCVRKIYRRAITVLLAILAIYRYVADALIATQEGRFMDVFYEFLDQTMKFAISALLIAFVVGRLGVYMSCRKYSVSEFVSKSKNEFKHLRPVFVVPLFVGLVVCCVRFIKEYIASFVTQEPVWLPQDYMAMLAAAPVAVLVAIPLVHALDRTVHELLDRMLTST